MRKPSHIHVVIDSPTGVIFEGEIKALRLTNASGPFDVIQKHTNFISAITEKITVVNLDETKKEIPIERGIIKINKTGVEIFLGIEILPGSSVSKN